MESEREYSSINRMEAAFIGRQIHSLAFVGWILFANQVSISELPWNLHGVFVLDTNKTYINMFFHVVAQWVKHGCCF